VTSKALVASFALEGLRLLTMGPVDPLETMAYQVQLTNKLHTLEVQTEDRLQAHSKTSEVYHSDFQQKTLEAEKHSVENHTVVASEASAEVQTIPFQNLPVQKRPLYQQQTVQRPAFPNLLDQTHCGLPIAPDCYLFPGFYCCYLVY